jgi:exodeoxyribonuclease-3
VEKTVGTKRLLTWNVNGIRAAQRKGFLDWLAAESPDILCVQETKARPEQLPGKMLEPPGYTTYWNSAEKKGYSGVAIYTKQEPLSVENSMGIERFDNEGRLLKARFRDFTLFNVYFPNGKKDRERLQYKMDFYATFLEMVEELRKEDERIVFCGDVNTAHAEIDLARPKENEKVSGFLPIEREWIDKVIGLGWVDTFRALHPEVAAYSWWDLKSRARERNVGWRIDYVFLTAGMLDSLKSAFIMADVMGSDHCPVGVELDL